MNLNTFCKLYTEMVRFYIFICAAPMFSFAETYTLDDHYLLAIQCCLLVLMYTMGSKATINITSYGQLSFGAHSMAIYYI